MHFNPGFLLSSIICEKDTVVYVLCVCYCNQCLCCLEKEVYNEFLFGQKKDWNELDIHY